MIKFCFFFFLIMLPMIFQFSELKNKLYKITSFYNSNKANIKGLKKTNKNFINQIEHISKDKFQFIDNLNSLNIFSDITANLTVTENKNKVSFVAKDKDKNVLSINVPNIFGKGENLNLDYSSNNDYNIKIIKPIVLKKNLLFLKIENCKLMCENLSKDKKEISIGNKYVNFGYGFPNYIFFKLHNSFFNINIKQGYKFTKIDTFINYTCNLFYIFNYNIKLSGGQNFGKINQDEKYTKNKKDTLSFFNISNRFITKFNLFNIYTYHELKFNYKNIRNNFENYLGAGVSIPLHKNKKSPYIDISIRLPLNKERYYGCYQISYDVIF